VCNKVLFGLTYGAYKLALPLHQKLAVTGACVCLLRSINLPRIREGSRLLRSDAENREILTGKSSVKNCSSAVELSGITRQQAPKHAICRIYVIESFKFDVALFINSILNQMKYDEEEETPPPPHCDAIAPRRGKEERESHFSDNTLWISIS
jgi:hypothetical protein